MMPSASILTATSTLNSPNVRPKRDRTDSECTTTSFNAAARSPSQVLTPRIPSSSSFSPSGPRLPNTIFSPMPATPSITITSSLIPITTSLLKPRPRKNSRSRQPGLNTTRALLTRFFFHPLPVSASPSRVYRLVLTMAFWFSAVVMLHALAGGGYVEPPLSPVALAKHAYASSATLSTHTRVHFPTPVLSNPPAAPPTPIPAPASVKQNVLPQPRRNHDPLAHAAHLPAFHARLKEAHEARAQEAKEEEMKREGKGKSRIVRGERGGAGLVEVEVVEGVPVYDGTSDPARKSTDADTDTDAFIDSPSYLYAGKLHSYYADSAVLSRHDQEQDSDAGSVHEGLGDEPEGFD